jgi:hypothetical protein
MVFRVVPKVPDIRQKIGTRQIDVRRAMIDPSPTTAVTNRKQGIPMTTTTATTKRTATPSTTTGAKGTAVKAPAKVQAETSAAITKAQAKSLDLLVSAVKAGVTSFQNEDRAADQLRVSADTSKVLVARAIGKLADHPATKATRGTKAGEPALTKIATLTGFAPSTLEPLFKAAMAIRTKGWHKRTTAPNDAERALVRGHVQSENDARYARETTKGKTTKPGTKGTKATKPGTKATFETIKGQITGLTDTLTKYTADQGFSNAQADELATALDALHDLIEKATTK